MKKKINKEQFEIPFILKLFADLGWFFLKPGITLLDAIIPKIIRWVNKIPIMIQSILLIIILGCIAWYISLPGGKVLGSPDHVQNVGMAREITEYYERTRDIGGTLWTGSMFCGMPTYLISDFSKRVNLIDFIYFFVLILLFLLLIQIPWWIFRNKSFKKRTQYHWIWSVFLALVMYVS